MRPLPKIEICTTTPAGQALELQLVTRTDLLRLKSIARLHGRGLPPAVDWRDLLQETFARVLAGARRQPEGVPMVAFLAGVMRSIKAEHWRRARVEAKRLPALAADFDATPRDDALCDPAPNLERTLLAEQQLAEIERLFADDRAARQIIEGLAADLDPEEIRARYGMSKTDYDSTRKRMRRALLREGLKMRLER
jgi:DNA-directed RNA polymerase specialized sigma24 family protein